MQTTAVLYALCSILLLDWSQITPAGMDLGVATISGAPCDERCQRLAWEVKMNATMLKLSDTVSKQLKDVQVNYTRLQKELEVEVKARTDLQNRVAKIESTQGCEAGMVECFLNKEGGSKSQKVVFRKRVPSPPAVLVALSFFDIDKHWNSRLRVSARSVTSTGFELFLSQYADTEVYYVQARWIAYLNV